MVIDTPDEKITAVGPPATQASTFSRGGLLAYLFLIVYASLYPFTGWQDVGLPLQTYLLATIPPRYWTGFDVLTNILGYIPLGVLAVYALYPRVRGLSAVLLAALLGCAVSGAMEATQAYLPSRVSSNLDLLTNSVGALIGALIGVATTYLVLERSRLRHLRHRWFASEASRGLTIFALWPLAQIYPQSYLFGHGQLLPVFSDWLSTWLAIPIDLGSILRNGVQLSVEQYWLTEAVITACGVAGALLALACMLRDKAPRLILLLLLLIAAVAVKGLATAIFFSPDAAFAWMTPGAQGGLLMGLALLSGLLFLSRVNQRRAAVGLLIAGLVVVNIAPTNPYFIATLETWLQGKFLNFNGAAQFLSLFWPFAALWFLLHSSHRVKRK